MSYSITEKELKEKGIEFFSDVISKYGVLPVAPTLAVGEKENSFVILSMEEYKHLRECELELALIESKKELDNGNYITESVEDHIKRIKS